MEEKRLRDSMSAWMIERRKVGGGQNDRLGKEM